MTKRKNFSEGVDVPTLDGLAFVDPRRSQVDIIQAVGRAIRKSENKTKGTIVIPIYISEEESLDKEILLSSFKKIWQIIVALKSQDDELMDCIDKLRMEKGSGEISNTGKEVLDKMYPEGNFFYNSKWFKILNPKRIEFEKIFRQKDLQFIQKLENINYINAGVVNQFIDEYGECNLDL